MRIAAGNRKAPGTLSNLAAAVDWLDERKETLA
jgi:hypothetical protein